ncbi:MAG: hypothetical protein JEZ07_12320 [Phycisphaerae bacterium]|nr:hypothetical protein [Phycisphaerae bacterium]
MTVYGETMQEYDVETIARYRNVFIWVPIAGFALMILIGWANPAERGSERGPDAYFWCSNGVFCVGLIIGIIAGRNYLRAMKVNANEGQAFWATRLILWYVVILIGAIVFCVFVHFLWQAKVKNWEKLYGPTHQEVHQVSAVSSGLIYMPGQWTVADVFK